MIPLHSTIRFWGVSINKHFILIFILRSFILAFRGYRIYREIFFFFSWMARNDVLIKLWYPWVTGFLGTLRFSIGCFCCLDQESSLDLVFRFRISLGFLFKYPIMQILKNWFWFNGTPWPMLHFHFSFFTSIFSREISQLFFEWNLPLV